MVDSVGVSLRTQTCLFWPQFLKESPYICLHISIFLYGDSGRPCQKMLHCLPFSFHVLDKSPSICIYHSPSKNLAISVIVYSFPELYFYAMDPIHGPVVQSIISLTNLIVVKMLTFFFFFFFFWFGFYGPFKNISLISSRSFIEGGRKPENPEKNHLTIRKQNLAFPHMTRARLEPQRWET